MNRYWTLEMGVPVELKNFNPIDAVKREYVTIRIINKKKIQINDIYINSVREERVNMKEFKWLNLAQMKAKYPEYLI